MASGSTHDSGVPQIQSQTQRLQIYPTTNNGVSPFWREKYEREAKKYWDVFYKRHKDKFFKDRHYLDKEWGDYFSGSGKKVILEAGCGAGNTIFPVIASYPDAFIYACDFSPRAIELVKTHKDFNESHVNAFVSDLTVDDLCKEILPSSVDIVTMIFMLSAVSPEKMALVLQNIRKVIKPNGYVLLRDYATGDLAQERFSGKDQKISDNFYVRGDGTRAYYFSNEFLTNLFKENGFDVHKLDVCCKQVENHSRELVMNRRWVQAVFRVSDSSNSSSSREAEINHLDSYKIDGEIKQNNLNDGLNDSAIDLSEGVAFDMFGISPSSQYEIIEVNLRGWNFKIKLLSKEYQHTCKSTGLMLWESARLMASVLAENPNIVAGKRVLELGCGCGGICSMIAASYANQVVATDGDAFALDLLAKNVASNIEALLLSKLTTKVLEWGNKDHIESLKEISDRGFDVIIGTDVTYIAEAILPLFATAKELIASGRSSKDDNVPALILCHIFRRVDEPTLLSAAAQFGFKLVDKWPAEVSTNLSQSVISNWFLDNGLKDDLPSTALNILLFGLE
ncbi:putative tRNA(Thr) (cytosine(32)-N(3))-methyltransferase [Lupinus albus]|uniref:Putative tRNA(Thr) (Cytosine(32)-N(3))-methyltransferase n=1 Tax=Lupinus albus TaxID=3870 RepID=A0A6A4PEQ7_LUPAL|nr:putative tRNA(Thr) (cytosine(32)-N(3))-methyltransferase [Lupinus albus]